MIDPDYGDTPAEMPWIAGALVLVFVAFWAATIWYVFIR